MSDSSWTQEAFAMLSELWSKGASASEASREINRAFRTSFSRNAIVSKVHRSGLERRGPGRGGKRMAPKAAPKTKPAVQLRPNRVRSRFFLGAAKPTPAASPNRNGGVFPRSVKINPDPPKVAVLPGLPPAPTCEPIDIEALTSKNCHWPIDPAEEYGWRYCGAEVGARDPRRRYCDHHRFRELEPSARRRAGF
jgi:hypothetical protein